LGDLTKKSPDFQILLKLSADLTKKPKLPDFINTFLAI